MNQANFSSFNKNKIQFHICKICLFNDLLLIAKEQRNKFILLVSIPLENLKLTDVADTKGFF